jgi:hypothetical protein
VWALLLVVLVTFALPPAGAAWLNQHRVDETEAALDRVTVQMAEIDPGVVCGQGRLPDPTPAALAFLAASSLATHQAWLDAAVAAPGMLDGLIETSFDASELTRSASGSNIGDYVNRGGLLLLRP